MVNQYYAGGNDGNTGPGCGAGGPSQRNPHRALSKRGISDENSRFQHSLAAQCGILSLSRPEKKAQSESLEGRWVVKQVAWPSAEPPRVDCRPCVGSTPGYDPKLRCRWMYLQVGSGGDVGVAPGPWKPLIAHETYTIGFRFTRFGSRYGHGLSPGCGANVDSPWIYRGSRPASQQGSRSH